jgi:hypothetical protein
MFGDDRWERVHVCAVFGDPGTDQAMGWRGGPAGKLLRGMRTETNNYFTVSLFRPGHGRVLPAFEELCVLGIDDVCEKIDPADVLKFLGEPNYRIATSQGSEQWGYRLGAGLTGRERATAFQHAVRVRLTGVERPDTGQEGLNRYLRLPFGRNTKARCGPGGWMVQLEDWA